MTQTDFNTVLAILSILVALKLGAAAILIAIAFVAGLLLGRAWARS